MTSVTANAVVMDNSSPSPVSKSQMDDAAGPNNTLRKLIVTVIKSK